MLLVCRGDTHPKGGEQSGDNSVFISGGLEEMLLGKRFVKCGNAWD